MVEYTGLERGKVEPVLEQLGSGEVRILREVKGPLGDQATTRHEIFHDVLAGVILDWRRRYSTEQAKGALRSERPKPRVWKNCKRPSSGGARSWPRRMLCGGGFRFALLARCCA